MTMAKALDAHGPETVFLDAGANIGTYSLYMAARGHRVWAVEPLEVHAELVKLYILRYIYRVIQN